MAAQISSLIGINYTSRLSDSETNYFPPHAAESQKYSTEIMEQTNSDYKKGVGDRKSVV